MSLADDVILGFMPWRAEAEAWQARLDARRPDLTRAPAREGMLRGIDVIRPEHRLPILRTALAVYRHTHRRLPDPASFQHACDGFFAMKFYGFVPMPPNPADKLDTAQFVPPPLHIKVRLPERPWAGTGIVLPPDHAIPAGPYILKRALASGHALKLAWPPTPEMRAEAEATLADWTRARPYGYQWGEWWYSLGPKRALLERDISDRIRGHPEWRFYVRRGELCFVKALWRDNPANPRDNMQMMLDGELRPTGGLPRGKRPAPMPPPPQTARWAEIAVELGRPFDLVRVDFLDDGGDTPILGELSLCDVNARRAYEPAWLDRVVAERLFG